MADSNDTIISSRGRKLLCPAEFLHYYNCTCMDNLYNKDTNPKGYVNMGTSVNYLNEDIVSERLARMEALKGSAEVHHYYPLYGPLDVRQSVAKFLSRKLRASKPIDPESVVIVNGAIACMEVLAQCVFEEGDVLLTPTPAYTRIFYNFNDRFGVDVIAIPLRQNRASFSLTASAVEDVLNEQRSLGRRVKGVMIVNPNNPLGEVYSPETLMEIMELCKREELHFIVDEVYAMSVYEEGKPFQSVATIPNMPDPKRTHTIWAFSKDMSLSGFRLGVLLLNDPELVAAARIAAMYQSTPHIVQRTAKELLADTAWLDEVYFPTSLQRLREASRQVKASLEALDIPVREAHAGFFLWADFRKYTKPLTREGELDLFKKIFNNGVFIGPGTELYCSDPGWFRVIFTIRPDNLKEGLRRITTVLKTLE